MALQKGIFTSRKLSRGILAHYPQFLNGQSFCVHSALRSKSFNNAFNLSSSKKSNIRKVCQSYNNFASVASSDQDYIKEKRIRRDVNATLKGIDTEAANVNNIDGIDSGNCTQSDIQVPGFLYFHPSCRPDVRKEVVSSFKVVRDYLTEDEENTLFKEVEPHLKRLRYEFDHWDDAIHGYRETERSRWGKASTEILNRVRAFAFPDCKNNIAQIHVLDLAKNGVIKPHVDSVRFCGNIICGMCLLSDAIMRLVHVDDKDQVVDVLLKRRSLYLMTDESRYKYTHEVLGEKESIFNDIPVQRDRRISIMCRNYPKEEM